MTTKKCFEPVGNEQPPAAYGEWKKNIDNYIEFINGHDVFGTNVAMSAEDEEKVATQLMQVADSDDLEKTIKTDEERQAGVDWVHEGHPVEAEDPSHIKRAKEAMLWSGRNITRLIAAKYPGRRFAWFRVNRWIR